MKYLLERHQFAPELNTLYRVFRGHVVAIAKAGSSMGSKAFASLAEYRSNNKPHEPFIHARIKTHYADPSLKWLERTYGGSVANRAEALTFAAKIREGLVPGGTVSIKTQLVG